MEIQHISPPFHIYNASAGSGKTFLLVQKYLETLLGGQQDGFHRMLALTFTNKAVFEMKFRILKQLHAFGSTDNDLSNDPMAINIMKSLGLTTPLLRKRARNSMQAILHDYAAFDVITLDSFTHRVIRSFAKDLGLSFNFNVSLQVEMMLKDTVDSLLNAIGEDEEITTILENFTFEKMEEEGTSWDIKQSLFLAAKLLMNENDRKEIQAIAQLSEAKKSSQHQFIVNKNKALKKALVVRGKTVIDLLKANGLSVQDFSYGTLYKRFLKLSQGDFNGFELGKLHQNLQEGKGIYPTKIGEEKKQLIEQLLPTLLSHYEDALQDYYVWLLTSDIKKQWVPLRLLTRLAKQLEEKQKEDNTVLLSTFNERIAKEILAHPATFIYERLGENYRHYFLDEFQDTSNLQWNNLIPLIENALVSQDLNGKTGKLLLVGDPKQSIYRWRGGDVDQFIGLLGVDKPFPIEKVIKPLTTNYRSASQIVAFNNSLYNSLEGYLVYPENKLIFTSAQQEIHQREEGYVQLDVLSREEIEEDKMAYPKKTLELIQASHEEGNPYGEMAVLVRKRKQARELTQFLSTNKLPVVSSDSLLIANSSLVQFLLTFIQMHVKPTHLSFKKAHLDFLYTTKQRTIDQHDFVAQRINQNLTVTWKEEGIEFDLKRFELYSLYDVVEHLCFVFPKLQTNEPFVQSFLDLLFNFCQGENSSPAAFLDYWEKEAHLKALPMADTTLGIKVLTIHQAKGLEFPVVFFPYADQPIHPNIQQKIWLDTSPLFGQQFPLAWINFSKRLAHYGLAGKACFERIRREEEIDAWNTFYVATTRAVKQLYIITKRQKKETVSYAGFLENFISEQNKSIQDSSFSWGKKSSVNQVFKKKKSSLNTTILDRVEKNPYEDRLILQLEQNKDVDEARDFGLRIHALFAQIDYAEDVEAVLNEGYFRGDFSFEDMELFTGLFKRVVEHPKLSTYFSKKFRGLNEQTILLDNGQILRPDRIAINEEQAVVLDYKTGVKKDEHLNQIKEYCRAVKQVTDKATSGYLIYFSKKMKNEINLLKV